MTYKMSGDGFTLLETLVSFLIFSLVASALISGALLAHKHEAISRTNFAIAELLKSRLAVLGITQPIEAGLQSGHLDGGITWTISIAPKNASGGVDKLFRVEVNVFNEKASIFHMVTFRRRFD